MREKMAKKNLGKDKNKTVLDSMPSFFNIFYPPLSGKELKIPPKFVRDVLKEMPDRMMVDSASGGPWPVKVIQTENGVFLRDGWEKFVQDKLLQQFDFLLFNFDGATTPTRLLVQIFDKSGLERDYYTSSALRTHHEGATSSGGPLPNKKDRARVIQEKIMNFKSNRPFFDRVIKRYNVSRPFTLFLPKTFVDEHFPVASKLKVYLENAKRESWEVNCTVSNGKAVFVGGWVRFARDNKLKIGDVCVFELVGKTILRVHTL